MESHVWQSVESMTPGHHWFLLCVAQLPGCSESRFTHHQSWYLEHVTDRAGVEHELPILAENHLYAIAIEVWK